MISGFILSILPLVTRISIRRGAGQLFHQHLSLLVLLDLVKDHDEVEAYHYDDQG